MFEPISFTESLDSSYLQALIKLEEDLKAAVEDTNKCLDLLVQFSSEYMMPVELWNEYFELTHKLSTPAEEREQKKAMILPSVYQFFYKLPIAALVRLPKRKLLKWRSAAIYPIIPKTTSLIKDLSFPNENLERKWRQFEKISSSMPSLKIVKMYKKMKALFDKIKAAEKNRDEEEWIKALLEVGDNEFVEHNIEYRLGQDLTNKKLWNLYIQYFERRSELV